MSVPSTWRTTLGLREAGVYYALLLLLAVLAVLASARGFPPYLSVQNLGNIAYQASLVGIMGVAMTVMLITGNFDLNLDIVNLKTPGQPEPAPARAAAPDPDVAPDEPPMPKLARRRDDDHQDALFDKVAEAMKPVS